MTNVQARKPLGTALDNTRQAPFRQRPEGVKLFEN
jgi:hypothetical protein